MELPKRVAVIGAGLMGHGIAQVMAMGGCSVRLYDTDHAVLQGAMGKIGSNMALFLEAGLTSDDDLKSTLTRISLASSLREAVREADFVTEAVPENLQLKSSIFKEIDDATPDHAILASNTSTLSITEIGRSVRKQHALIITHWFNPPHIVPVVEVVRGQTTSQETLQRTISFLRALGKEPVNVLKEVPGFLVNRIQSAMFREVLSLLAEGVAEPEDLDRAVRGSFGIRLPVIGPLRTADLVGLDLWHKGMKYLYPFLSDAKEPQAVLTEKIAKGHVGQKAGRGFFEYGQGPEGGREERQRDLKLIELLKILYKQ